MGRVFTWLLRICLVAMGLSIASLLLAYYFATRSIPDYSAEYEFDAILGEIEIVRDNNSVPHIFAQNDGDVFFGLGFVHAQDRLWQMMLARRTAQGRLSEVFGRETFEVDEYMRRLDIYQLSRQSFDHLDEASKTALVAYSNGVNAWLKTVQKDALGRGAPEYFVFEPKIAPWSATDSLAVLRLLAVQSSDHLAREILRARTSVAVGQDLLQDILPDEPSLPIIALPEYASLFSGANFQISATTPPHPLMPVSDIGLGSASNIWAAMPDRTAAKASLFAADPHNGLSAPSSWMLARLELQSGGVIGASIPGIPLILSGRSKKLAWGMAASFADDVDVFVESVKDGEPSQYKFRGNYAKFKTRQVIVDIKDEASRTLDLKWTKNGPVLPSRFLNLDQVTPRNHVMAISANFLHANDTSFQSFLHLMRTNSASEAVPLFENYTAPIQNLIIADENEIAFQTIGKIPKRRAGHVGQGRIPSQGWLARNQWVGYFDYSKNPAELAPRSGMVANTNNKITDQQFPNHISHSWGDTYRMARLLKLLNERKIHTRDSFMEAQLDTISFAARAILPLAAKELWFTDEPAAPGTKEALRQQALELLANWNGEMSEHMPEPLIYAAWMRKLQLFIIRDELGPLSTNFQSLNPVLLERVLRNIDGASRWCDIRPSTRIETCTDIARMALDETILELSRDYSDNIGSWRWGQAHQATHDHEVFGSIPLLSWITNIRQSTSGGDHTLMRGKLKNFGANPFLNVNAAGYRALIDFSDLESSLYIISTGQSGHPLSRHYDDLAQIWRRNEYIPMALDPELARAGSVGVITLQKTAGGL